jgi:hypothetical protein
MAISLANIYLQKNINQRPVVGDAVRVWFGDIKTACTTSNCDHKNNTVAMPESAANRSL